MMEESTKNLICPICKKVFSNKSVLNMHTKVHHKEQNKEVNNEKNIVESMLGKKEIHKCEICHNMFASKKSLTTHNKEVHEDIRPHKCNICDRSFYPNSLTDKRNVRN